MTNKMAGFNLISGVVISFIFFSCTAPDKARTELPEGWFIPGYKSSSYEIGIDGNTAHEGRNSASIKSRETKVDGFGTLMQISSAKPYAGKRVRMSAYLKSKDVKDWAGLWLRVDVGNVKDIGKATVHGIDNVNFSNASPPRDTIISSWFDNMHDGKTNRSIKGTTEWSKYDIVLDVPEHSVSLNFGALLSGTGQVWFDNLNFEVVDNSVEITGVNLNTIYTGTQPMRQVEPVNLGFESVFKGSMQ